MARSITAAFAGIALALGVAATAMAQNAAPAKSNFAPTRTVTIIVPYSPGGGTDAVGRLMAKALEEKWGQTVIVDNRTGGNGSVGAAIVARAQPDGHTMVLAVSGIAINAHLMKLPYDTTTAFAPVTAVAYPVATLLATPDLPANDLKGLVELVRKEGPDKRTSASPDPGSRLMAERIFDSAGIKLLNVPYKGAASFVGDISAGRVDVGIASVTSGLALINGGKLKALGIMGTQRIPALPNVATFKEQGFSGLDENSWYGLFAPAGTPPAIVDAIQKDIASVLAVPEFRAKIIEYGSLPGGDSPTAFSERFQRDIKVSGETIRRLGMTAD
ncbi:tripartite tricarboxylate transporter substrate binding protein [Reyranella sp. MMS21-HV4-11]|uniref:Tripartite tricarboxylate transporter substrate binding protein n=1 Tax=Reyranella humidisoli TaxID=2849149 RepID=A0ABS6IDW7_9HYPH|nr:tripartite tricarboxylate transporter substrate binding protein [Reyranella sp. MMS21-HV4-11]MBU8872791.1 tripartite tricarboxylate transporter substrate binding protein [Reyranella sp. MMS21-HV4-11]